MRVLWAVMAAASIHEAIKDLAQRKGIREKNAATAIGFLVANPLRNRFTERCSRRMGYYAKPQWNRLDSIAASL